MEHNNAGQSESRLHIGLWYKRLFIHLASLGLLVICGWMDSTTIIANVIDGRGNCIYID